MSGEEEVKKTIEQRFWEKVNKKPGNGCWEWKGAQSYGYGRFGYKRVNKHAHRISYELLRGPIPEGMELDHLCRNHGCVNPYHMEIVTHKTNVLRGIGITAQNSQKTHCIRGHLLNKENIYYQSGGRICKICKKISNQKSKFKRKLARQKQKEPFPPLPQSPRRRV